MAFRQPILRRTKVHATSEQALQNACITFLQYRGFWTLRINSGMVKTEKGGMVRLAMAGVPDLLAIKPPSVVPPVPYTQIYWFEIKKPGKKSTPIQKARQDELRAAGCQVYEIHSLEELAKVAP